MKHYVGLDVSMEETMVCVMEGSGEAVFKGRVSSTPEAIADLLRRKAPCGACGFGGGIVVDLALARSSRSWFSGGLC